MLNNEYTAYCFWHLTGKTLHNDMYYEDNWHVSGGKNKETMRLLPHS